VQAAVLEASVVQTFAAADVAHSNEFDDLNCWHGYWDTQGNHM
jgi:hypothetical protein